MLWHSRIPRDDEHHEHFQSNSRQAGFLIRQGQSGLILKINKLCLNIRILQLQGTSHEPY